MNAIRNLPVVIGRRKIGLLIEMVFDLNAKQATEMIVACGLRGKRRIECSRIKAITDDFILADDMTRQTIARENVKKTFAFDPTGVLIGLVSDYVIDELSMRILAVEIITEYLPGKSMRKIWVFDYECIEEGEILLPASISCGLIELKKEEEI